MEKQQCTIFARDECYSAALERVRSLSSTAVGVVGEASRWTRLTVRRPSSTLTLNSLESTGPGDRLSGILLGAANYVRKVRSAEKERQQALMEKILASRFAIGCVATPDFASEPSFEDCILELAGLSNGVVFTGAEFLDSGGRLILDAEGTGDPGAHV